MAEKLGSALEGLLARAKRGEYVRRRASVREELKPHLETIVQLRKLGIPWKAIRETVAEAGVIAHERTIERAIADLLDEAAPPGEGGAGGPPATGGGRGRRGQGGGLRVVGGGGGHAGPGRFNRKP
jgi:hypothetical protein